MSYREINGNLLDLFDQGEFEMIGHGANCHSTMDSGIAAKIKERFPVAYYADKYCSLSPLEKLGHFSVGCGDNDPGWVVNFYTQFNPGPDADYIWLKSSLRKFKLFSVICSNKKALNPPPKRGFNGLSPGLVKKKLIKLFLIASFVW